MKKRSEQKRIVINIHQLEPLEVSWVIIDDFNAVTQTVIKENLSQLLGIIEEYPIYVIIPGQDVLLCQTELPKLSHEKLLQALPYALEDKLIDDVSHLHFAIKNESTQGMTFVAIINKNKMEKYLQLLHDYGIKPYAIIPTMLALPQSQNQWIMSIHNQISYIRTQAYHGFTCDTANLSIYFQALCDTLEKPERIFLEQILNLSSQLSQETELLDKATLQETGFQHTMLKEAESCEHVTSHIPKDILIEEIILNEKDWIEKIALCLIQNPYINLLQGIYRSNVTSLKAKKIWKWTSVLASIWLSVLLGNQLITYFILRHAKTTSDQEISVIYRKQFPAASNVIAPRERMETALKKAAANSNKNNFLTFLGLWGNTAFKINGIKCLNLTYHNNRLNMNVSSVSFEALDSFINDLIKQGLRVKQQNTAIVNSEVKAEILIAKK